MEVQSFSRAGAERRSALQRAILGLVMPTHQRHFAPGQLQFLTSSIPQCGTAPSVLGVIGSGDLQTSKHDVCATRAPFPMAS